MDAVCYNTKYCEIRIFINRNTQGKAIPCAHILKPRGFQKVEATRFQDNRHMNVVRLSASTPQEYSWCSLLLEAESTIVRPILDGVNQKYH
jgi:hypothetical protein